MNKIFIFFGLILSGCASTGSKEELREVFELTKNRKFEEVQDKLSSAPSSYQTFHGEKIRTHGPDKFNSVEFFYYNIKTALVTCEDILAQMKEITLLHLSDDEREQTEAKIEGLKQQFGPMCALRGGTNSGEVRMYSTVDLAPTFKEYERKFARELNRIAQEPEDQGNANKLVEDEKEADYQKTPAFYNQKLCEMYKLNQVGHKFIERENKAAELSGFVDKKKLYETGQMITAYEGLIEKYSAEMKTKFGKSWSRSDCK